MLPYWWIWKAKQTPCKSLSKSFVKRRFRSLSDGTYPTDSKFAVDAVVRRDDVVNGDANIAPNSYEDWTCEELLQ